MKTWKWSEYRFELKDDTDREVLSIGLGYDGLWGGEPPNEADGNLIAAAPELLNALKAVVASAVPHPREHPTMFRAWDVARDAIAKAEGGR